MRTLKKILLDIKSSKVLFFLPLIMTVLVCYYVLYVIKIPEEYKVFRFGDVAQEVLVIAFFCWPLLVAKRWISGGEAEILRSIARGQCSCAAGIGIMILLETFVFSVVIIVGRKVSLYLEGECFRVLSLSAFLISLFYLFCVLLRTVDIPMMIVIAYCLVSIIMSGKGHYPYLIINPGLSWKEAKTITILRSYFPYLIVAGVILAAAGILEKKLFRRRW